MPASVADVVRKHGVDPTLAVAMMLVETVAHVAVELLVVARSRSGRVTAPG